MMRWIWRGLAVFVGRKAWEAYQQRQRGGSARPPGGTTRR